LTSSENISFEFTKLKLDKSCPVKRNPLKRVFDILFSLSVLLFSSPFLLTIALLIKTTSKGPIFYGQKRVGRSGKTYINYKFRTMKANAEEILEDLLKKDPILKEEWLKFWKLKNDPRITSIGRFLRKTSLDEFPQFWNVLKGNLSVVGPRPVVQEEITRYFSKSAAKVLSVRPGITGLWQVSGRNNLSMEERVKMESDYIDQKSFFFDLKIILKTIPVMLFSKGAY